MLWFIVVGLGMIHDISSAGRTVINISEQNITLFFRGNGWNYGTDLG